MEQEQKLRLFDLPRRQINLYPNLSIFSSKIDGKWHNISSQEFQNEVDILSKGLIELGVKPNEKVGLIADSSVEWHIVDFAIQQVGAITVAMYPNISDSEYQYIFNNAEIKLCIVSNKSLYNRVNKILDSVFTLKFVFSMAEIPDARNWNEIKDLGRTAKNDFELETRMNNVKVDDLATLIYTSGTTGKPKGVMLSHNNIMHNVMAARECTPVREYGKSLTFLPPCHAYERMVIYTYMYIGITTHIAESLDKIGQNLGEVKPDIMTAVPRLLEKVYEKIMRTGLELTGAKRKIFDWAVEVGSEFDPNPKNRSFAYNMKLKLAKKLVLDKWYNALGGQLKTVYSGSASLPDKLTKTFLAAGIPIYEGYGMTEASPLISVNNYLEGTRVGTVGLPVKFMEVKLAEDGEILVKGPNVMMGYYKNPEETAKTIIHGWLHTGDIAVLEEGRFIKIVDRKKEMFKISGGKYIVPQPIEKKLVESSFIEQAMVVGDSQKYASAFIVPSYMNLLDWSKNNAPDLVSLPRDEFLDHPTIVKKINTEVRLANQHFGNWEQIKRPAILHNEFTVDSGELTPTLKMKRKVILERYKEQFNEIYK